MPLYEYRCPECDEKFEKIQKFSARPKAKCPDCGKPGKRLLSAPAIRFKGSGWYVTDYATKKKPPDGERKEEKASAKDSPKKKPKPKKES